MEEDLELYLHKPVEESNMTNSSNKILLETNVLPKPNSETTPPQVEDPEELDIKSI